MHVSSCSITLADSRRLRQQSYKRRLRSTMILDDAASALIKEFIVSKLDGRDAEADSDILADYCLALLKSNDIPDIALKASVAENLKDFLPERYESFTDDLFTAIATKSYDPSQPAPVAAKSNAKSLSGLPSTSRSQYKQKQVVNKRRLEDLNAEEAQGLNTSARLNDGSVRPIKQARRGGRLGRGPRVKENERAGRFMTSPSSRVHSDYSQHDHQLHHLTKAVPATVNGFPGSLAGFPGINPDPADPSALIQVMQQMMGMMAGMAEANAAMQSKHLKQRCRDYDTKGYCTRGASCLFDHGDDRYVVPSWNSGYDPGSVTVTSMSDHSDTIGMRTTSQRNGGYDKIEGRRKHGRSSELAYPDAKIDKRVTSIVVEAIPEDQFKEQIVHEFFAQFGHVESVDLQPYKRLAVVTFDDHENAKAAYESPKVIFNNRFVKVNWAISEDDKRVSKYANIMNPTTSGHGTDVDMEDEVEPMDLEVLARKQEEAQRRFEEQKKLRVAAIEQKAELDAKLKVMEAERLKVATLLAKRNGQQKTSSSEEDQEHTRILKEQLANLEAEAKSLGIEPDDTPYYSSNSYRAYSYSPMTYHSRDGYRGRGRGRGSYMGNRGGLKGHHSKPFSGVKKVDNRPKSVMVIFRTDDYGAYDEALRQHLLFGHEAANLVKHPGRHDAAIVTFEQRYQAENFLVDASTSDALGGGKTEISWYNDQLGEKAGGDENLNILSDLPLVREIRDLDTYNDDDE
nr:putative rna-binding protein [Quercus suber]